MWIHLDTERHIQVERYVCLGTYAAAPGHKRPHSYTHLGPPEVENEDGAK